MIGNHKGIYHSTLTAFGPAFVTIKSDVLPSKKKGSYFVVMEHEGDEQFYNVENEACGEALKGLKGQSVTVKAEGSRGDATITVSYSDGPREKPKKSGPPLSSGDPVKEATDGAAKAAQAMRIALRAMNSLKDEFDMPDDQKQAVTSSIFIYLSQNHYIDDLPVVKTEENMDEMPDIPF